jgi:dTMP kinase
VSQSARNRIVVPTSSKRRCYGHSIPNLELEKLTGKLIVVEGGDGSGRSTQIAKLVDWLEGGGHATVAVGLKHSALVSEELEKAQQGNILSHTTLSLFYATDFADQFENTIIPALKSGTIVLCDRYIYTLMARDLVRGMNVDWLRNLYGIAVEPDAVFYLDVPPDELVQRTLSKYAGLDYWESGMDLGLSRDIYDSFLKYQALMRKAFLLLRSFYGFSVIDGTRTAEATNDELRQKITAVLASKT